MYMYVCMYVCITRCSGDGDQPLYYIRLFGVFTRVWLCIRICDTTTVEICPAQIAELSPPPRPANGGLYRTPISSAADRG